MIRRFGYRIDLENYESLEANGIEFKAMMRAYGTVAIGYGPSSMMFPSVQPIKTEGQE